ncbi:DUF4328 domain-containing protein [Streptomyces genisteinicus]|uniref:DUF4328 domain-containing protein n=1 Tax=Streptomyces genisteinicus TaxID=2768068 RepID=A0A7H0HWG8_9ACTN|nr:DUF4328 domain-containing protein [Streptomyces genisteinicus]QNP64884.1 DUF4328 domain-containing protein [Streptomyces genisteinicus]
MKDPAAEAGPGAPAPAPVPAPGAAAVPAAASATPNLSPVVVRPAAPGTYRQLRSPVGLGRAAVILLGLVAVTDIAAALAAFNIRRVVTAMSDGGFLAVGQEEADFADMLVVATSGAQLLAMLAVAPVFLVWFHRVRVNAGIFAPDRFTRGPGWALGGWFIPIAFFWIPRGVAAETWRASRTDPHAPDDHERATLLNVWWGLFVAASLATRFADRRYERAESLHEIVSAADLVVLSCLLDLVAAVVAALFVHRLTHMQHARAVGAAASPAQARNAHAGDRGRGY